ncbi:metallophosphoesterase [Streptomyces rubellomurinus]|uniref:Metallophosphoesterase n=2 Tax=Streptomyces TaxID=1883 RepID=A0A0F2T8V9_STRR3|nr:metallophosphoesterase [Streptomyces rubellomurinus]KJS54871.1 metallophosphoesterase [Streptomyces rubellomurinus subsp. indigoferus]KJS58172.1 metallophosphoesterase [Streptomyces rubellomurinus]
MVTIAQLSDIHLGQVQRHDGGKRARRRAEQVMAYLDALPGPLDAVLVTGDLADHGLPAEYAQVARVLKSRHPVLTCPGNHDVRGPYREGLLGEAASEEPINRLHELPGADVLMLDSSIPGKHDGLLDDATLTWLDERLAGGRTDLPALVAFHHPPVELSIPYVDEIRQFGEARLAEVLRRHPRVVALFCGHSHTPAATTFAGLPLLVAPGVVSTTTLPCEGGRGISFDQPPMLAFHVLHDDRRLTTHYRVVL